MNRSSVTRAAVGMGSVTAVSRAFGFVRVLMIAAVLGTTYLGNTFQAANSVSNRSGSGNAPTFSVSRKLRPITRRN